MSLRVLACSLVLLGPLLGPVPVASQSSSADSARLEAPGPCTRRTPLVISEIHYHPPRRADSNNLEFVEVFNSQAWTEDLSGYRLDGAVQFTFPPGTTLAANTALVVAVDPTAMRNVYGSGLTNVTGPFTGHLQNHGEKLRL